MTSESGRRGYLVPAAGLLLLGALMLVRCDWFESQVEVNYPPETELTSCGPSGDVEEGQNVKFVWTGSDVDGQVTGFEWAYDSSGWTATSADSTVIDLVTAGQHTFRVRSRDNKGEVDPTPAECSFTALAKGVLVPRTVLAEMFTTNICRNCDKAEAALDSLLAETGPDLDRLVVVAYHDKPSDNPGSDGLATDETDARISWYTNHPAYPADQWPIVVFDGIVVDAEGANTIDEARTRFRSEVDARLEVGSPIQLGLTGEITSAAGNVAAAVKATGRLPDHPLVLRFVVIENGVQYHGQFASIFDFVTRDILPEEALTLEAIGDSVRVERAFSVAETWKAANMDVIVFVQDDATLEVLQAARLKQD